LRTIVLEKERTVAAHQTGHNSGVIHSGIYYKPGSLKARLCVPGAAEMVRFCREQNIPHDVCGKLIVATRQQEFEALEELRRRGEANGVPGLETLGPERIKEIEPHATGLRGLLVPVTAITDFALVARRFAELIVERGGVVRTGAEVVGLRRDGTESVIETTVGDFRARYAINCAGLFSDRISRMAGAELGLRIIPFRGEYYELAPESRRLVRGLIYPVPDARFPFLGVHFTKKVAGGVEAGPNAVLAFKREGYSKLAFSATDALTTAGFPGFWKMAGKYWKTSLGEYYRSFYKPAFVRALQTLVPEIKGSDLSGAGSGVRAQAIDRNGKLVDDFRFAHSEGMIHVCNVPSPAATASLAISRAIVDLVQERFDLTPSAV
jgi:L-2-hydroxyglutarate oxidase LhgO